MAINHAVQPTIAINNKWHMFDANDVVVVVYTLFIGARLATRLKLDQTTIVKLSTTDDMKAIESGELEGRRAKFKLTIGYSVIHVMTTDMA